METHSMKLCTHCCANLKATRSLEVFRLLTLQTVANFCPLCASACADPTLSFYVSYHFTSELLLFPVASTLL
ncbi:unnamed protein product [Staurois parvus]|uniref:Uncharacterized protein n=1 Tax=Staurois parvus TaxID=386267 RepID=A0ABN9DR25_9NEOB|nr:unnamed protein product [Staurois parvus]